MKNVSWSTILLTFFGAVLALNFLNRNWDVIFQLLYTIILISITIIVIFKLKRNYSMIKHWAMHHNLEFKKGFSRAMRFKRFYENKGKKFFKSKTVKSNFDKAPAIEGKNLPVGVWNLKRTISQSP